MLRRIFLSLPFAGFFSPKPVPATLTWQDPSGITWQFNYSDDVLKSGSITVRPNTPL